MMNPPAIHGPAKAGVQKAAATRPAPGARFAALNKVSAKTTANPIKMMPKPSVNMSAMKGPMMNMGKSVPVSSSSVSSALNQAAPKLAPTASKAIGLTAKALGPVGTAAALVTPDQGTKTEPGNPVFRKTDAGKTSVAGYRSSTTPRATDVNTQQRMVGSMARRGGLAPSVKNQELPAKIAPVQTKEPGTLSAPKAAPASSSTAQTFKQAFAAARKEAEKMGSKSTGQFEYKGGKYQTNIQGKGTPKKPEEKFVPMSQQKVTSVGKSSSSTPLSTTPGSTSIKAQPAPPAAATAGMSSAAEKSGISQTPTKPGTEFGAGKSLAPLPTTSTPAPAAAPKPSAPLPSMAQPGGGASNDATSGAAKMNAIPQAAPTPPNGSGSVKFKDAGSAPAKTVAESVQVGNYKYRIV
jgi:hypothetical protein